MEVLEASTAEGRGGSCRKNTAEGRAKNGETECRDCQQNTNEHLKEMNTVRLFRDEQPLGGSSVTCFESRKVTAMETLEQTVARQSVGKHVQQYRLFLCVVRERSM
jgi:hypothetical protein